MSRVKRGTTTRRRHKKLLELTRGYRHGRKNLVRMASQAVLKAGTNAYRDRRNKKREFRSLWIIRINAAVRPYDLSYQRFIYGLKKSNIDIDRKILSQLANRYPTEFEKLVTRVKNSLDA